MTENNEKYPISPMHKQLTEAVWYELEREGSVSGREDGTLHRLKWLFRQKDFPCRNCGGTDSVSFMVLPTGVFRSCSIEGWTEKVQPNPEEEIDMTHYEAVLLEDIICNNKQANDVVKRYHQERLYLDPVHTLFPMYRLPRHGVQDESNIK